MRPVLYSHPFSSYCQKVLTALYENGTDFDTRMLGPEDPSAYQDLCSMWPVKRFPILIDGEKRVFESSIVIEYLDQHYPGPVKLIPDDADAALDVRMMDRFFDNYISTPQQKVVFNAIRPEESRDPYGVQEARDMLDAAYGWLDQRMADREWAAGGTFSLADCAAALPSFMRTGRTGLASSSPMCGPIAADCSPGRHLRGRWTRPGLTALSSRSAHRIGTRMGHRQ